MTRRLAFILLAALTAMGIGYQVTAWTHHTHQVPTFATFPTNPNDPARPSCWVEPSSARSGFEEIYYPHLAMVPPKDPGFEVPCPTNLAAAKEVGG